jgi:hypothetical protein
MAKIEIPSNGSPDVTIESVSGSLQVKGWDEDNIRIDIQNADDLHYTADDDMLTMTADSDCVLRVPTDSNLTIQSVNRDAYVANLDGEVSIESVSGSLTMKNVGETKVENVSGNLTIRGIDGDLYVNEVSGNAAIRDVEGDLRAEEVHANLSLRNIEGEIVAKSDGNADLRLDVEDTGEINVEAAGNLFCALNPPGESDLHFESGAQSIHINTTEKKLHVQASEHQMELGDGGVDVWLKAGGHIDFRCREDGGGGIDLDLDLDFVDEANGLADEISEQVSAQVEAQIESLNAQLEGLQEKLRHTGDRATRKAQERVAAAQRRLQVKLQNRGGRGVTFQMPKKADPVSEQERMLVLQMVQDKKISVAQAEMLLNTIEGRAVPVAPKAEPPAQENKEGDNG